MAKPFDAATRHLLEAHPADRLAYVGLSAPDAQGVESVASDLSTVTVEADKVLLVRADEPWLAHIELQSSYDAELGARTLRYNVLLDARERLPVQSVIVLLRPEADGPRMTGRLTRRLPDGRTYLEFEYLVVRAWQKPVDDVLAGGLGTLPLAPLAAVTRGELPGVIEEMRARIAREAAPAESAALWTATYVLMGLRYPPALAARLLQGVRNMRESSTYQAILKEGREEGRKMGEPVGRLQEARALLLRLGGKRFGAPDAATRATVEAINSLDRAERLLDRLLDVESWQELLA